MVDSPDRGHERSYLGPGTSLSLTRISFREPVRKIRLPPRGTVGTYSGAAKLMGGRASMEG